MAGGKKHLRVVGAAVVLPTEGGGERYLYHPAVVPVAGFTEAGVKHAVEVGLIELVDVEDNSDDAGGDNDNEAPSKSWNHARINEWAAKQDPAIEFTKVDPEKDLTIKEKLEQIAAAVAERSK